MLTKIMPIILMIAVLCGTVPHSEAAHCAAQQSTAGSPNAGTFYVIKATGSDARTCSEIKNISTPAQSITYAISCAEGDSTGAGDQISVGDGTYNERVVFGESGAEGNPYTLAKLPGTSPVIDGNGLTVPAFDGLVSLVSRSYITVTGFVIKNSNEEGIAAGIGPNLIISENTISGITDNCISISNTTVPSYSRVLNNEAFDCGKSGILLWQNTGGYFLIAGNLIHDLTGVSNFDGIQGNDTNHIIAQNNILHSMSGPGDYLDFGGDGGINPTENHHIVARNNIIYRGTGDFVGVKLNNRATRAAYYHNLIDGINMEIYEQPFTKVAFFNNTFINSGSHALQIWNDNNTGSFEDLEFKNNIFGFSTAQLLHHLPNQEDGSFGEISMTGNLYRFNTGSGQGINWCLIGSCPSYPVGDLSSYNQWRTDSGQEPNGGIYSTQSLAQLFVDSANRNVTPQTGSDAIDAGENLTTTVGSGSGTSVPVADSRYFTDGYGLVQGDMIKIGSNPTVSIVSINEGADTLAVSTSITWGAGDPVNLVYSGSAPDVGAVESP